MAYAAVISLKQTTKHLLSSSHISVVPSSQEILEFLHGEAESLQQALERLDRSGRISSKRLNALDGEIREAVHKLEDLLELHETDQYFSRSESYGDHDGSSHIQISLDLEELREDITSIAETAKKMGEDYTKELDIPSPEEEDEDDDASVSSNIDFGVKMVGLSNIFNRIKKQLLESKIRPDDFGVFSLVGVAGTGRTIAAKIIFEDLYIRQEQSIDCGAWVTIGPNYQVKEILLSILAQLGNNELLISQGDDEKNIGEYLYTRLKDRRYVIVLDDVWDKQVWDYLRGSFPQQENGSLVLLTTSLMEVARFADCVHILSFQTLDDGWIWDWFCDLMFGEGESCPPELEEAGKKIAKYCKGRRFSAYKVILFLSKAERTPEYWNKIAADEENSIFKFADEISEISKIEEELQLYPDDDEINSTIKEGIKLVSAIDVLRAEKMHMFPEKLLRKMEIISLIGMAGIGKTTVVKKIFEDQSILGHFNHLVWVTLGPKYKSEDILIDILAQIYPDYDKIFMKGDDKLVKDLCEQLCSQRCLIVFYDLWNKEALHYLKKLFPDIKGKALVTTRLEMEFGKQDIVQCMRLLNEKESWCLFCQKVFAKEMCPPKLEKAGKKIVQYCEGLPLMILTVADLLSKAKKTPKYWNNVANKQNSILLDAHDQISKVLLPSYEYLPQHLRACFLYMGIFPEKYDISFTKFITLYTAEGFVESNPNQIVEDFVVDCLYKLISKSLVIKREKVYNYESKYSFHLHPVFWHLSNCAAMENKFFHAWNSYGVNSVKDMKGLRRLCIRKSILLGMKDVHDLMASISTARSLVCTGPSHRYPVPMYFGLRLLRVLDVLAICFYDFPIEVLKLIHLRFLALTCNGKLPTSISKLWNLQYLIIDRHLHINSSESSSYLPVNIWDMKELRHLQVIGRRLPTPNHGAILPNLKTLLGLSADSCTEEVLEGIPNLTRLGIRIELVPDGDGEPFHLLNHISCLKNLVELKCTVVNPGWKPKVVAPPPPVSMFSSSLVRLSLNGLGYPWECMRIIGKLENLEELKLRWYAFRGPEWETDCFSFSKLKFLLIEDTDLMRWKLKVGSLLNLECLCIRHCYKLEELPHFKFPKVIEVFDCNPWTVTWAKQTKGKYNLHPLTSETLKVQFHSSWDCQRCSKR